MSPGIHLAQRPEADALLGRSPVAALVGVPLDRQVPTEWAFSGPNTVAVRRGRDDLDAREIAAADPEAFAALLSEKPAVHRRPGSMAGGSPTPPGRRGRIQRLCRYLVEEYDGDAEAVWRTAADGRDLLARLQAPPGFGKRKTRIFLILLDKQYGVRPEGRREAAGAYGEEGAHRSAAGITGPESPTLVRAHEREVEAAAKAAKATKGSKTTKNNKSGESSGNREFQMPILFKAT